MEVPAILARASSLPHGIREFLDEHLTAPKDLLQAPSLVAQLRRECGDLEREFHHLSNKVSLAASAWIARSHEVGRTLRQLDPSPPRDGNVELGLVRARRILAEELPLLTKEVGRIEMVRLYAETALRLEALVGNLEDAALSLMSQSTRNNSSSRFPKASSEMDTGWKQEKLWLAINTMKDIERILLNITNRRPRWTSLILAVDFRVEKTLAILRPQTLRDHRALLASLGWPPSLTKSNPEKDKFSDIPNPLILMHGDKKEKYSQSFLGLCALQHLQSQREARRHDYLTYQRGSEPSDTFNLDKKLSFHYGLWTIDELAYPITPRMEYHFSRWSDQPEFIFALVYKVTRDFIAGVDNVLQPLIDQARLVGYSAKEAWVSTMVKMVSEYLQRSTFPALVKSYDGIDGKREVISSWLHLVDLMISFDKRMQALASSGTPLMGMFAEFELFSQSLSIMSIFGEHPEWLQMWAKIELTDAEDKLKSELEDEKSWSIDMKQQAAFSCEKEADSFLLSTWEDYQAPRIADSVVKLTWAMIERGHTLPNTSLSIQFIKASATLFLDHFIIILLNCCQEIEATTDITEHSALLRVAASVNAARYCESVLQDWSEDINLVEMSVAENNAKLQRKEYQHPHSYLFEDQIMNLMKLETDGLVVVSSALLLRFDSLCQFYVQNLEQWEVEVGNGKDQISDEAILTVSPEFVEALDMLKDRITLLKLNLNSKDFLDLWRSIASGLDHFIFHSIPLSNVRFSPQGVAQFRADMRALFLVFKPFCARPEAFFPCTSESLKLLAMPSKTVDHLLGVLSKGESGANEFSRVGGLLHISMCQVEKILSSRNF